MILGFYEAIERSIKRGLPIMLVGMTGVATLKLTGFVFAGGAAIAFAGWYLINRTKSRFYTSREPGGNIRLVCGYIIIMSTFLCANPYLNNLLHGRHILHPALGAEKLDYIVSSQTRKEFVDLFPSSKLLISLFSASSNHTPAAVTPLPLSKIPFAIYPGELDSFAAVDVRIGGWGPLFGGILLIAVILSLNFKFHLKRDKVLFVTLILLVLSIINPESWWARYNPQLHTFAVFLLILMFRSRRTIMGVALVSLLILNSILLYQPMYRNMQSVNRDTIASIVELSKNLLKGM